MSFEMAKTNAATKVELGLAVLASDYLKAEFNRSEYERAYQKVHGRAVSSHTAVEHFKALREAGYITVLQKSSGRRQAFYEEARV